MQQGANKAVTGLRRFHRCCGVNDKITYLRRLAQSFITDTNLTNLTVSPLFICILILIHSYHL